MLIKQALSEVLQLVASQLRPSQFVVFACFRLLRKTKKVLAAQSEPQSSARFIANKKMADTLFRVSAGSECTESTEILIPPLPSLLALEKSQKNIEIYGRIVFSVHSVFSVFSPPSDEAAGGLETVAD
jgi:hypothetical protein